MNFTAKIALFSAALSLTLVAPQAQAAGQRNLMMQPLATTGEAQDLMLHADNHGSTYLYVEEQHGARLAVYDVSDPAHMKLATTVETGAHGSYDFVSALGDSELIAFRDGSGSGVIDLRDAKAPKLAVIAGAGSKATELLGTAGYLASSYPTAPEVRVATQPRSVQVVETATEEPRLVGTVANVTRQVTRPETGTTFLLGQDGITVVRQVGVERAHERDLALWNSAN